MFEMIENIVNSIINKDCLEFMDTIPDHCIDLVLTSPPYNMTKRKGGWADKTTRYDVYDDNMSYDDYIEWTIRIFNLFDKILKENACILYNFSYSIENPGFPYELVSSIIQYTNFTIADTIIWKKSNSMPYPASPNRLQRIWEYVFVFVRKDEIKSFNTNKQISKISKTGQKYYKPMFNFIQAKNNDNPTPDINQATFSTDMVLELLKMYCKEDYIVYDPFMGTGTTAVACIKYGCKYIGTEISKKQIEYALSRINVSPIKNIFF
jgi:site-specific DNA-methyltransferase (adenine-specific)/modification methylase